jgi:hypothetical protein
MPVSSNRKPGLDLAGFDIKDAGAAAGPEVVKHLLVAVAATVVLQFIPYVHFLMYPLRLLVTFIHEGSHAMAAVLTGGHVRTLLLQMDNGSGVTYSGGGIGPVVSSAGYLGATLYGTLLLAALRRGVAGRRLLAFTGALIGALTLFFVRPVWPGQVPDYSALTFPWTLFWGIALSAGLLFAAKRLPERAAAGVAAFLGVQFVLNALFDLKTLFDLSVSTGAQTDAQNMFRMTLIPAPVWAVLWIVTAFAMLWAVLIRPAFKARRAAARS